MFLSGTIRCSQCTVLMKPVTIKQLQKEETSYLTGLCSRPHGVGDSLYLPHDLLPGFINLEEHFSLVGELPLDVGRRKDTLQIQPVALTGLPLVLITFLHMMGMLAN